MLEKKKPYKKRPEAGCETCINRGSDFIVNHEQDDAIRCYCKVRFVEVDVEVMSKDCDFYKLDNSKLEKEEDRGL